LADFGPPPPPLPPLTLTLCRYLGVTLLTFTFLFLHYIPSPEKRGPGIRFILILSFGFAAVAGYRVYGEEGVGEVEKEGAFKTLIVQGATCALAVAAIAASTRKEKKKKKKKN